MNDYSNIELIYDSIVMFGEKIDRRGIQFNFPNNYGVSIMFGNKSFSKNFKKKTTNKSDDCEISILHNGKISFIGMVLFGWSRSVKNNVSTNELVDIMVKVKNLHKEG
jgi:hypothetical protein